MNPFDTIASALTKEGFALNRIADSDDYRITCPTRQAFYYEPVFTLPADLLDEYLNTMSLRCGSQPDPLAEALSLTRIHAIEYLTTDHGDGRNATTALGFRRTPEGEVEFFVDQDPPESVHPVGEFEWVADRRDG